MLKILHLKKKVPKQVKYVTKIDVIVTNVLYNVKGHYGLHGWLLAKLLFVVLQICAWTVM